MLKPTFVTTANGEPLTANRGLKFAVDCENVKLNVPISCKMDGDTTTSTAKIASTTMTSSTGTTVSSSGSAPIIHAIVSPLMHGLKPPGKLHTTGSPADSSKAYKQVWENYSLISGLYAHTEEYKETDIHAVKYATQIYAEMLIGDKKVNFQIDCGASINIIPAKHASCHEIAAISKTL